MSARSSPSASAPRARPISLTTACASGATAIQLGVEAIRRGETKASLCVGTDCSVTAEAGDPLLAPLGAVERQRRCPRRRRSPSPRTATASSSPKGSAALVLEDYDAARRARRRDPRGHPRRRREVRRFPPHPLEARRLGDHRRAPQHLRGCRHRRRTRSSTSTPTAPARRRTTRWRRCRSRRCSASACAACRSARTSR